MAWVHGPATKMKLNIKNRNDKIMALLSQWDNGMKSVALQFILKSKDTI